MVKIAHLITDEKFPDSAFHLFETAAPGSNHFYIVGRRKPLVYIKKIKPRFSKEVSASLLKKLTEYDLLLLHSLNPVHKNIANRMAVFETRPKMLWIGMGFDYYDLIYPDRTDLLLARTRSVTRGAKKPAPSISSRLFGIKRFVRSIVANSNKTEIPKRSVIRSIDYFAPVLPNEYALVKMACDGDEFPLYVDWNYSANTAMLDDDSFPMVDRGSNDILVGNSASVTNNHFDCFNLLEFLECMKGNIYVPLSYGPDWYRNEVLSHGYLLFGGRFRPLVKFLPFDVYIKTISCCAVALMNQIRQEALGNVGSMLYMGATVFLREESPLFQFLKSEGAQCFSIQQLEKDKGLLEHRLSDTEVLANRVLLRRLYGRQVAVAKTKGLIDIAVSASRKPAQPSIGG